MKEQNRKSPSITAIDAAWRQDAGLAGVPESPTQISVSYLLVSNIPCYRDRNGRRHLGRMWYRDLSEHCKRLSDFTLASPGEDREGGPETAFIDDDPAFSGLKLLDLPHPQSLFEALISLPATVSKLSKAVKASTIVHSGIAGWPIPYGWLLTPLCKWSKTFHVIVVESAPWRIHKGMQRSLRAWLRSAVFERMARLCVSSADLVIFTHDQYRRTMYRGAGHIEVIPASWIDEEIILPVEQAIAAWDRKSDRSQRPKVLFAGRLNEGKGVKVMLEAMALLAEKKVPLQLDILGEGELAALCAETARRYQGATRINLMGTVEYGPAFFELVRQYHAVIVPSLSDEQPRIVYDAYSQAVPVLASRTPGLVDCVRTMPAGEQTGVIFTPNDASSLAETLEKATRAIGELRAMGMRGLELAHAMTHQAMHQRRNAILEELLLLQSAA